MLNRPLFEVLKSRFGNVRITNENVVRVETGGDQRRVVSVRGENYQVDCPLCGDTKGRLSISYRWLEKSPLSNRRRTDLAHCYNEMCAVTDDTFWSPILQDVEMAKVGAFMGGDFVESAPTIRKQIELKLPDGFTLLDKLPSNHPAIEFVMKQYNRSFEPSMLAQKYGVGYTELVDVILPQAQFRVIFPIHVDGKLVAWQGRATVEGMKPRWYLPPGFIKPVYNADKVTPIDVPVIAEGIPSAIACGDCGVGIFGKTLTQQQLDTIAGKWPTVLIATDPETFVPDNRPGGKGAIHALEMKKRLDRVLKTPAKLMHWPVELLEAARKHNNGEEIRIPDPADIGLVRMAKLIERSLHGVNARSA